ncbi:MAG: hypothetical protein ACOY94_09235 [Bacillota bacterium]
MKVRTEKGTLNLRGIERRGTTDGAANYEFANEVAGFGAGPAGEAKRGANRVGRNNQQTTVNLRGEYGR